MRTAGKFSHAPAAAREIGTSGVWGVPVYTPEHIRAAEEPLLATMGEQLMRNAAFAVAVAATRLLRTRRAQGASGARVVVLCGPGNNGGDGLYAAAELARRGAHVDVLASTAIHAGGLAALQAIAAVEPTTDSSVVARADLIIDALLGIGSRPGMPPLWQQWAQAAAASSAAILAVDIPSGLDPMRGGTCPLPADVTVTFGGLKPAHVFAADACGTIELRGLGIDTQLNTFPAEACPWGWVPVGGRWPAPEPTSHKYSLGTVELYAGSEQYPGAAVLCAAGAVRATSSMVRITGPCAPAVVARFPSVVPGRGRCNARVIGPGRGTSTAAAEELLDVLRQPEPVVVDADALTVLAGDTRCAEAIRRRTAPTILTPHRGECARLLGDDYCEDPVMAARQVAQRYHATVVLKGHVTVVVSADAAEVFLVPARTSWAATPGSGDVLAGVLGALAAANPDVPMIALGAMVHAQATAHMHAPCDALQLAEHLLGPIAVSLDYCQGHGFGLYHHQFGCDRP